MGDSVLYTPEQEVVLEEFSILVGKVLTQAEAAFSDKVQRDSFKKLVERYIYDARNNILQKQAALKTGIGVVGNNAKPVEAPASSAKPAETPIEGQPSPLPTLGVSRKVTPMKF